MRFLKAAKEGTAVKGFQKLIALALAGLLSLSLSACSVPMPGFAEYDVSGYIQALLDSSYHDSHDGLIAVAKLTEEKAREYNTTTVENAAVTFCNTYGLTPSEEQLGELQKIMKQAFALTKYTVKDERKVETGYYLEVEVAPITNFAGREQDLEQLKEQARQEISGAQTAGAQTAGQTSSSLSGDGESSQPFLPMLSGSQQEEADALFMDKVLEFCKRELANISYDLETRSLPLDIRQTEDGELQLDLKQIDAIDRAVVRFE